VGRHKNHLQKIIEKGKLCRAATEEKVKEKRAEEEMKSLDAIRVVMG